MTVVYFYLVYAPSVPPKVEIKQSEHKVLVQTPCELQAIITGIPIPDVKWYKDEKPVEETNNTTCKFIENISALSILTCFPDNSGAYECVAENAVGKAEAKVKIVVHGKAFQSGILFRGGLRFIKPEDWHEAVGFFIA